MAVQDRLEDGQQRHVQGGSAAASECRKGARGRRGQHEWTARAPASEPGAPVTIPTPVELLGRRGELHPPEVQIGGECAGSDLLLLPGRIVTVLQGQRWARRRPWSA